MCARASFELCPACETRLAEPHRVSPGVLLAGVPVFAATTAHDDALRALRRIKDQGQTTLARPLGRILRRAIDLAVADRRGVIFVCVPDSRKSFVRRGFHTVSLLVKRTGHISFAGLLRRERTRDQRGLTIDERRRNLENTMVAHPDLRSRPVILIDDVITTGATAYECVRALEEVGAEVIAVVAVTVVPRKFPKFAHNA